MPNKINPSSIGLIVTLTLAIVVYLFYFVFIKTENYLLIDNPTSNKIDVLIGEENYSIAPYLSAKANLSLGEYKLIYKIDNKIVLDTVIQIKKNNALINPTLSEYYIFSQFYGIKKQKDSILQNVKSVIDDKTYTGEVEKSNQLSIDEFDYNLEDDFPDIVSDSELKSYKKIFREEEFKNYYSQNFE